MRLGLSNAAESEGQLIMRKTTNRLLVMAAASEFSPRGSADSSMRSSLSGTKSIVNCTSLKYTRLESAQLLTKYFHCVLGCLICRLISIS